ncbi:MAG TPA: site-specific integrase [Spirochaetota bacterium]|nr:site-specific integrase [Spirochaetota bacterium]HQO03959.1 site-specific integrase [Spirochaetota bacterium]
MTDTSLQFKLFKRKVKKNSDTEIWYFRTWDAVAQRYTRIQTTGVKVRPIDPRTGEDVSRDKAMARAVELHKAGKAPRRKNIRGAIDFCVERVKTSGSTRGHILISCRLLEKLRDTSFGRLAINQIDYDAVLRLQDELVGMGRTPRVINQTVALIRAACKVAVKRRFLRADPFQLGIDKLPENLRERGALCLDEVRAILTLPDTEDPRETVLSILAITSGARRSEMVALTWNDLDFNKNSINVNKAYTSTDGVKGTKNRTSKRMIPLVSITRERLLRLRSVSPFPGDADFIFYSADRGRPMGPEVASAFFKTALHRIGLTAEEISRRNLSLHSARHSFVTLSRSHASDFITSAMSGQAELQTMNRYSHAGEDQFDKARDVIEKIFSVH